MPLERIREMSPRQIHDIYFHERNPDGTLKVQPATNRLNQLMMLIGAGMVKATPEQLAELKRRLADDSGRATGGHPEPA